MAAEIVVGSIEAAVKVLKLVHSAGLFDKAYAKLRKKYRFAVFGQSGTGKSNLLLSIENPLAPAVDRYNRTVANRTVRLLIAGRPFLFIDTPGHGEYKDARDDVVTAAQKEPLLRRKRFNGVLNVVSYGYHEGPREDLSTIFEGG